MEFSRSLMLKAVWAFVLGCTLARPAHAQGGSSPRRLDPVQREQQRQVEHQMIEATLESRPERRGVRMRPLVLAQVREDFLRIQVIDRKLRQATPTMQALNLGLIAKSMSEIRKRAVRLKTNLALPEGEGRVERLMVESGKEPEQLRLWLSALSDSIYDFVSNPLFISAKVVDTRLSAKARQDLEQIIQLSGDLKRSSEKLKRAAKSK